MTARKDGHFVNDMEIQELPQYRGKLALFYDTETTDLPRDGLPLTAQPHVAQLAWQLIQIPEEPDGEFKIIAEFQAILRLLPGASMGMGTQSVHGISQKMCDDLGFDPVFAFESFFLAVEMADVIVAHNEQFDRQLVRFMYKRLTTRMRPVIDSGVDKFRSLPVACTMEMSIDVVKMPPTRRMLASGRSGYKNPRLTEAYESLVGGTVDGAHDAMVDVRATVKVFAALLVKGAVDES